MLIDAIEALAREAKEASMTEEELGKNKEFNRVRDILFGQLFKMDSISSRPIARFAEKLKKIDDGDITIYGDICGSGPISKYAKDNGIAFTVETLRSFPLYFATMDPALRFKEECGSEQVDPSCENAAISGQSFSLYANFLTSLLQDAEPDMTANDMLSALKENQDGIFLEAAAAYLRMISLYRGDATKDNAVSIVTPRTAGELQAFRYLYSVFAAGYCKLDWTRSMMESKYKKAKKYAHQAENAQKKVKKLESALNETCDALDKAVDALKEAAEKLDELEKENQKLRETANGALQGQIDELTRQLAKSRTNEARIIEKYNNLKARTGETAEFPVVATDEPADGSAPKIREDARLEIFAAPAATGKVDMRYNEIAAFFPNSRLVNDPDSFDASCDAVVLLTKFMSHSQYYKAKQVCENRGLRYIHVDIKSPEAVRDQILNPSTYRN